MAEISFTEFAVGAVAGMVIMAALLHSSGFRSLCLTAIAALVVYLLWTFGVDGAMERTNDLVALSLSHPVFFVGLAFGKFVQGIISAHARGREA